jgi:hypothetical protein
MPNKDLVRSERVSVGQRVVDLPRRRRARSFISLRARPPAQASIHCSRMPSRKRRDTRLSKLCPGITVDANGPSWKGPTAYPLRTQERLGPGIGGGSDDGHSSVPDVWH